MMRRDGIVMQNVQSQATEILTLKSLKKYIGLHKNNGLSSE